MSAPTAADIQTILRQLVAFPTVSSDSNLALIEWVEQWLSKHDIPHWRVNEEKGKASLLAHIGPGAAGGIVLSGHTDVVPVKDQPWTSDPFTLTERDGKFYGRGTCDMKAFLALALAHVEFFKNAQLKKPVWFAFSHDEEIGCLGAAPMANALLEIDAKPALVVVGEPTDMQLVGAHKAILSFETTINGHEAHSSMPEQGVNAVMVMGELIHSVNKIADECRKQKEPLSGFPSPYSTVHVGVVEGGTARNIIPRHARMLWEVRPLPGVDTDRILAPFHTKVAELEAAMKRTAPDASITTRRLTQVHGLKAVGPEEPHIALACHLAQSNQLQAVSYGTEGGIFQHHDLPTIICGPGSIDQAHQPDEFITLEQLDLGAAFMRRVAEALR